VSAIPIKTEKEVEKMRRACRTAGDIRDRVSELVRPGITTKEIDEAAADFFAEAKVKSAFLGYRLGHRVFPGNICISLNDEVVHGIAGPRRIQYGDIVKLDIGVIQDGWVGDTATTVAVGMVEERVEQLLRVTESALDSAIKFAIEGMRLGDICAAIEDEAVRNDFSVVREFVGHGVGRKLHEEPQIPNYGKRGQGPKLRAGMTLAIEPMINMGTAAVRLLDDGWTVRTADGMPSAHFEHTVLIRKEAPEILTWSAKPQLK
jgi:methionyl aminopeptidase